MPVPLDDFDEAPTKNSDCRAASSSAHQGRSQGLPGAGEQPPQSFEDTLFQVLHGESSGNGVGEITNQPHEDTHMSTHSRTNFDTATTLARDAHDPTLGAPGPEVVTIKGGAFHCSADDQTSWTRVRMQNTYASTTECILQNLPMAVGNPSGRCFANAPWRAFTWTCALLQETRTQPWGNLHKAVQESLELAEAVDIHQLPGLHSLWDKHDLNVQGAANRFELTVESISKQSFPLPLCRDPAWWIPDNTTTLG